MSRFDSDYDPEYDNAYDLWRHNVDQAMRGKRGKKLLVEFRDALLALPEPRLIEGALCAHEGDYKAEKQGAGVCAIGAFVLHRLVKMGFTPEQAFEMMPSGLDHPHFYGDDWTTVQFGKAAGLTGVLAWYYGSLNDEDFAGLSPEDRYGRVMDDIVHSLALPALPALSGGDSRADQKPKGGLGE